MIDSVPSPRLRSVSRLVPLAAASPTGPSSSRHRLQMQIRIRRHCLACFGHSVRIQSEFQRSGAYTEYLNLFRDRSPIAGEAASLGLRHPRGLRQMRNDSTRKLSAPCPCGGRRRISCRRLDAILPAGWPRQLRNNAARRRGVALADPTGPRSDKHMPYGRGFEPWLGLTAAHRGLANACERGPARVALRCVTRIPPRNVRRGSIHRLGSGLRVPIAISTSVPESQAGWHRP